MDERILASIVIVAILLIVGIITAVIFWKKNRQDKPEELQSRTNVKSDWYDGITRQIYELKSTLTVKDYKKFKLNVLLCIAQRVAEFSPECIQCMSFQGDITTAAKDVGNLVHLHDKKMRKNYFNSINTITNHLQKQHKLVTEGYYTGICMAIGAGFGVAFGTALEHIGSGIPFGVAIGVAIGAALDAKAKRDGRVLCTREAVGSSKTVLAALAGLGLLVMIGFIVLILLRRNT